MLLVNAAGLPDSAGNSIRCAMGMEIVARPLVYGENPIIAQAEPRIWPCADLTNRRAKCPKTDSNFAKIGVFSPKLHLDDKIRLFFAYERVDREALYAAKRWTRRAR
jgi:hypothetical protein